MTLPWTQRPLTPLDLPVGPCAWRLTMLPEHAAYLADRTSLYVAMPEDDDAALAAASPHLCDVPLMLGVAEPEFARQLPAVIARRLDAAGRERVELLLLRVTEPAELKSGGLLQVVFDLRERGVIGELALATDDVLAAEWLALNTAARAIVLPWSSTDQSARYRAIGAAREYGMACLALTDDDHAFHLGTADIVLPVLDRPIDADAMSAHAIEASWQAYRESHAAPPPLPRSRPPE